MTEITFEQVEAEVRRLADENPDYIYESYYGNCFYNPTERNGVEYEPCIFGQALNNLGVEVHESYEEKRISTVLPRLGISASGRDHEWATWVQHHQDRRVPWGKAVAYADERAGKR